MASEERKQYNREVIAKQHTILAANEWHCCGNCTHLRYSGQTMMCAQFNAAPPLPVLIVGCECWEGATLF